MSARVRRMARPRRAPGVRCSRWRFRQLVIDACEALPSRFHAALQNVALTVEEYPSADLMDAQGTLGLYQGTPLPERGTGYTFAVPDKITIYRRPLLEMCHDQRELHTEVRRTVWHEVAHYFGLGDDELPY